MTKSEEFEILLTRWEDDIRRSIGMMRKATAVFLCEQLLKDERTFAVENTRIEIDGVISGANVSMICVWNKLYRRECQELDGGDEIIKVIHKLIDENYKWSMALDEIRFKFYQGAIPEGEIASRINEVTEI